MVLIFSVSVNAQTALRGSYMDQLQLQSFANMGTYMDSSAANKKWFMSRYIGISSSVGFFNGGNAAVFSIPIGIQINRRLHNNWYAFAGVTAAPAYVNFNNSYLSNNAGKSFLNNSIFSSNQLNLYSRAEMGLMYINDQKTFSISGSISVERSSYPMVPATYLNTPRPNTFIAPKN